MELGKSEKLEKDCEMRKYVIPVVVGVISVLSLVLFLVTKKKKAPVEIDE